jgi:hypothetical protein
MFQYFVKDGRIGNSQLPFTAGKVALHLASAFTPHERR